MLVVLVIGEAAFGLSIVVYGMRMLLSPEKMWRTARRRTAWEYRDPARAQELQPSETWITASRAKGLYTIVLGLIFVGLAVYLVLHYG